MTMPLNNMTDYILQTNMLDNDSGVLANNYF